MAQDLSEVGILAEVLGLELVGADFGVSAVQVARFPVRSKAAFNIEGERDRDGVIDRVASWKGLRARMRWNALRISLESARIGIG